MAKAYGISGDDDDGIGFTFKLNQIINALNEITLKRQLFLNILIWYDCNERQQSFTIIYSFNKTLVTMLANGFGHFTPI
ncbi:hypothetical protein BLOT_013046 [Blomia tropicalis]|nr:hypothetical protein BLOT_013046 [Blomia tropicalis]